MHRSLQALGIALVIGSFWISTSAKAQAQQTIALKSGESTELGSVWWVAHCRSIMVAPPQVEILEAPPGLTLSLKEGPVVPRRLNCTNEVPGAVLVATAKDVTEPVQGRLVYRINFKIKDGDRQLARTYEVMLFPATASAPAGASPNPPAPTNK